MIGEYRGQGNITVQFGVASTPINFQPLIKRFLRSYLGTPEEPVPFGGRDAELAALNRWLAADRPRNLLVTAPAARGKTSLLVHWINSLSADVPVAFVPISIRYATNRAAVFYGALAARLAAVLGEVLPPTPADAATFYREKVTEYFDRFEDGDRKCLVVIDGLDEASGWSVDTSVLPSNPARGLKIVASARQLAGDSGSADWLRRLGWDGFAAAQTMDVPPLTRDAIAQVLQQMAFPIAHLGKDVDVVAELYRLTERGDPLLLDFYVKDLWAKGAEAARFTAKDLASLKPGFVSYFRQWFKEQERVWQEEGRHVEREREVLDYTLAILSCALGPITLGVVSDLLQRAMAKPILVTKELVAPISRFVVGDGVTNGFAFGHPKLADYFRSDYFGGPDTIARVRAAFVDWGEDIVDRMNSGALPPDRAPEYCLLYYVQHLEEVQPAASLLRYSKLVDNGWRLAWLAHDEGLRGFARDVEVVFSRLLAAAKAEPAQLKAPNAGLAALIRCLLTLSSIRSVGAGVPPNFLAELVREGRLGVREALHMAHLKPEAEQVKAIEALAPYLGSFVADAEEEARTVRSPILRVIALAAIARFMSEPLRRERLAELRTLLDNAKDDPFYYNRGNAEAAIARCARGDSAAADDDAAKRSRRAVRARKRSRRIDGRAEPPPIPATVSGSTSDAVTLASAVEAALEQSGSWMQDRLSRVATHLPPDVRARLIDAAAQGGANGFHIVSALAPVLDEAELRRVARLAMKWETDWRRQTLAAIAPYVSGELFDEMLDRVLHSLGWSERESVLAALLPFMTTEEWDRVLDEVLQWDSTVRDNCLTVIFDNLTDDHGRSGVARVVALPAEQRRAVLTAIVPVLGGDVLDVVVQSISHSVPDIDIVLPMLPADKRAALVGPVYQLAYQVQDGIALAAAYGALARRCSPEVRDEVVSAALAACRNVTEVAERGMACAIASAIPGLTDAAATALLDEAEACADKTPKLRERALLQCVMCLSPAASEARTRQLAARVEADVPYNAYDRASTLALLLFSRGLPQDRWDAFFETIDPVVQAKPASSLLALVSAAPRLDARRAVGYVQRAVQDVAQDKPDELGQAIVYSVAALSPHTPSDVARQHAAAARQSLRALPEAEPVFLSLQLPYLDDDVAKLTVRVLEQLSRATRPAVLMALALFESGWLDLLGLYPALANGRPAQSVLTTVGGSGAIEETYRALNDVRSWWP